jgi:hypothetical protein
MHSRPRRFSFPCPFPVHFAGLLAAALITVTALATDTDRMERLAAQRYGASASSADPTTRLSRWRSVLERMQQDGLP